MAACAVMILSFPTKASAQTANMTADVTVLNTLTINPTAQLNFGVVAAAPDPALQATMAVGTDGTYVTTPAGVALIEAVDDTAVSAAQIEVSDGANGATINVNINNVVDPIFGAEFFALDSFLSSYNGGADVAQVINTPFAVTFDSAFGGGTNTLDLGATISTTVAGAAYGDGAYAGTYDVVFSY